MKIFCEACGREITDEKKGYLCDYPLGSSYLCKSAHHALETHSRLKIQRVTCDRQMCGKCAAEIAPGMHFCPAHARKAFAAISVQRWELPPEVMKKVWVDEDRT